jgi:hypothetical protein
LSSLQTEPRWTNRALRFAIAGACMCVTTVTAANAHAYVVRQTASGAMVHWPQTTIEVEIDPSVTTAITGSLEGITTAMAGWSSSTSGPQLTVTEASGSSSPAVDYRNVVYFAPGGYPAAGNALAITLVSYDDSTGEIVDADIVINGKYAFAILAAGARAATGAIAIANEPVIGEPTDKPLSDSNGAFGLGASPTNGVPFDLVHVLAHETGHLLGLEDAPSDTSDLMYLYTAPGDAALRAPATDDVAGVTFLYAGVPTSTSHGCASSSIAPAPATRGSVARAVPAAVWVAAFAIFGLALGRGRRTLPAGAASNSASNLRGVDHEHRG